MKLITLNNVKQKLQNGFGIKRKRLYHPTNKWRKYKLLQNLNLKLSDSRIIIIEQGFTWDLSSVPRFLWSILPPDGDWEIAALIHDYLYQNKINCRKFADNEMLKWSNITNGTNTKLSFKNFDNYIRYMGVRLFGVFYWNK